MRKLAQSVRAYIRKHDLVRPGDRLGVAVSGGADSVALLQILTELRQELGIILSVIHLNHKLRGAEADEDEHFVRQLAAAHEFEFLCESWDVKSHCASKKLSLETAARELRYEFFARALSSERLNKIATAHTIDDQAETVLLKLARGAGTRGLAGIYPKIAVRCPPSSIGQDNHASPASPKFIVRPLLSAHHRELESYLDEIGQPWREDSSNRELLYTRNRVRHEVLPRLAKLVNSRVYETLAEAGEIARSEEEFWSREVARLLPTVWKPHGSGGSISRKKLDEFDRAVRRRVVRSVAQSLGLLLEFKHVEEVLNLGRENGRAALPQNWSATLVKGEIRFSAVRSDTVDYEYFLPVPGKVAIPEASIIVEVLVLNRNEDSNDRCEQMLDLKFIKSKLVVRNWRAGDRFWPENTKESRKIKELLQDRHVTGDEKKSWPVLAAENEIVWVRDLGIGRDFRAQAEKGLLIKYSEIPPTTR